MGVGFLQGTKTGRAMAVFDKSAFKVVRKTLGNVCALIDTQRIGKVDAIPGSSRLPCFYGIN